MPRIGDGLDHRVWRWPDAVPWGRARLFALAAFAYVLGSIPAQILIRESGLSAVFFIPAGITVAFLLRLPSRHWWIILAAVGISEAVMDIPVGYPPAQIAGFVAANMLEPLVGATIVRRWCGSVDLARLRHVSWFLLGAVVVATGVGAAVGSLPVHTMGDAEFPAMFFQWWLGDAVGVILVGTAILAWGSSPDLRSFLSWGGITLLAASIVAAEITIRSRLPITFLVLIGIVLAGAAFGIRAVAVMGLALAVVLALDIAFGPGVLVIGIPNTTALLIMKVRLGVFTLAGLVVAAEAFEGRLAIEEATAERARSDRMAAESAFEREVALRLQRALLPKVPVSHPGVTVAARYEAGGDGLIVGGDWYDVFSLPGNRIGFTVGDVVGHGLDASAAMGRMRTAVRVLALETESPGELLSRLDEFAGGDEGTEFATASYALLDLVTGTLAYASAGHPPMLVVALDGTTSWLSEGRSPPICGGPLAGRAEAITQLQPGALVLGYTDGLVERRDEGVDVGLRRLEQAAGMMARSSPSDVCDQLIERMGIDQTRQDDVVVVALRLSSDPGESPAITGVGGPVDEFGSR